MEVGRRDFLKVSGCMTGLALCRPGGLANLSEAASGSLQSEKGMLIDVTKCVGCWYCYAACKQVNGLPETGKPDYENPPELAPAVWSTLDTGKKDSRWRYRKHACMHCTDAACVKVCPTGALSYHKLGFVQYDKSKCSGCGYCSQFCPFEVPRLDTDKITGDGEMDKCTFCISRVTNGEQTACAQACPTGAIKYGNRSELLKDGKERVEADGKLSLYGEKTLGGLHVMYVLDDSPESYGLPADPNVPPAALAHDILQWVGIGVTVLAVGGFAFNYMAARFRINRREGQE